MIIVSRIAGRGLICADRAARPPAWARSLTEKASVNLVRELRQRTGAPINKCKQALQAEDGDLDAAASWLRKSGITSAQKKAGRGAHEGVVGVCESDSMDRAAVIELNSETDFVARNEMFQALAKTVATAVLAARLPAEGQQPRDVEVAEVDVAELSSTRVCGGPQTVGEAIVEGVTTLGENIVLRRASILSAPSGIVSTYVHNAYTPNFGRIAAAVALDASGASEAQLAEVRALGQRLAMQVVAASPIYLDRASVPASKVEEEAAVITAQLAGTNKPKVVVDRIVEGKLNKYYDSAVFLEQDFVLDPDVGKVVKLIEKLSKELGVDVKVTGFVRYQLGAFVDQLA